MLPWQADLLNWYRQHARDLPWRRSRDPYAIWVSEIMLQQTQVATVIPFWERWMARFPTVDALAAAEVDDVLSLWQGLGYYRRGRMLREGAQFVAAHGLPQTASQWRDVPGVGPYTAGAIASIAFQEPTPLVDGNVERVFARRFGLTESGPALNRRVWSLAAECIPSEGPGDWNQALMELGATVCTPRNPSCMFCPVSKDCIAYESGSHESLPNRPAKVETVNLRHSRWLPVHDHTIGLCQVEPGKWWAGMWDFPLTENGDPPAYLEGATTKKLGQFRHAVTKHRILVDVHLVTVTEPSPELRWFHRSELESLALPSPGRRALAILDRLG